MRKSTLLLTLGTALTLSLGTTQLSAAGGGGGGGFSGGPTNSAPRYDATAEYQKGVTQIKAKDYKGAVKSLKRSISVASKNANAQYLLGFAYMQLDDHKKARKPLEKAVKYNPNLIDAQRDLAITYHSLGSADKANATLGKLTAKQSSCADTCAQKGELAAAVSAVKKALNGAEQASVLPGSYGIKDQSNGDAVYLSAVSLINEGRYEAALDELDEAGKSFGPHPDILTYIGFANRKMKRFDVAENYYQRALTVAPNHLGAIEYYGELKVERGDMQGAKAHLARLDQLCTFGCYEAEELRRWIFKAQSS